MYFFRNNQQYGNISEIIRPLFLILLLIFSQTTIAGETKQGVDFPVVAYHVDLRVQVMPLNALKALAKEVSGLGFNTIIMEWEATYPYKEHSIISSRYAYTRDEVKAFIEYCDKLGLDVIPLQQNLGHAEYILMHERYAYLRADKRRLSQVDPTRIEAARELFEELYSDMLSVHKSKYVHIGGDETRILDCDRCKKVWDEYGEEKGKSKLYVEYMKMIADIVIKRGKIPLLWADMILAHPEAISEMPNNAVYIDWNYGWKSDRFGENPTTLIDKYGLKFWGATALRSAPDDYHVTSWDKHMKNQTDYIPYARRTGFEGMVLTSWSTSGEYGYEWFGPEVEVVELYPIRQAYPHAYPNDGFRMNTSAFVEGIRQEEPIVLRDFAREYASTRFDLTATDSDALWTILQSEELYRSVPVGSKSLSGIRGLSAESRFVEPTLTEVRRLQAELKTIVPRRNHREFAHYVMQVDLREFYLSFRVVEDWTQSEAFTGEDKVEAVKHLQVLLDRSEDLDDRFSKLFRGVMYDSEIVNLNDYRNKKILLLHKRLTRER